MVGEPTASLSGVGVTIGYMVIAHYLLTDASYRGRPIAGHLYAAVTDDDALAGSYPDAAKDVWEGGTYELHEVLGLAWPNVRPVGAALYYTDVQPPEFVML